jgi:hypothetical protein
MSSDSWWDDGSRSEAAHYFRERIELDPSNECNLCNGAKFAALRLLLEERSMYWEETKSEVLELAFERVLEDPTWRPRPRFGGGSSR